MNLAFRSLLDLEWAVWTLSMRFSSTQIDLDVSMECSGCAEYLHLLLLASACPDRPTDGMMLKLCLKMQCRFFFPFHDTSIFPRILSLLGTWWMQESDVPAHGRAAHSAWRNYDDFNEFFWCLLAYFKPCGLLWGSPSLHKEIEFLFLDSVFLQVYPGLHMLQLKLKEFWALCMEATDGPVFQILFFCLLVLDTQFVAVISTFID